MRDGVSPFRELACLFPSHVGRASVKSIFYCRIFLHWTINPPVWFVIYILVTSTSALGTPLIAAVP